MNEFVFKANYHQDPATLHVGCEAPRAYFIPYQNEKTALKGNRNASDRFVTLCGDWDFTFYSPSATCPISPPRASFRIARPSTSPAPGRPCWVAAMIPPTMSTWSTPFP